MKKTFIKPLAKTVAMQTENLILAGSNLTQGSADGQTTFSPSGAEAKRGPRMSGPISATTFAWN